jgi:hypothetical protein
MDPHWFGSLDPDGHRYKNLIRIWIRIQNHADPQHLVEEA